MSVGGLEDAAKYLWAGVIELMQITFLLVSLILSQLLIFICLDTDVKYYHLQLNIFNAVVWCGVVVM